MKHTGMLCFPLSARLRINGQEGGEPKRGKGRKMQVWCFLKLKSKGSAIRGWVHDLRVNETRINAFLLQPAHLVEGIDVLSRKRKAIPKE